MGFWKGVIIRDEIREIQYSESQQQFFQKFISKIFTILHKIVYPS